MNVLFIYLMADYEQQLIKIIPFIIIIIIVNKF